MLTLLKLDFFFVFSFAAQLIPSVLLRYDDNYTETVLVFVLGGIGLSLALVAVYKENKIALLTFIVAGVLAIAYFVYKLVVIATPVPIGAYDPYEHTRQFLIFTTVVAIVLVLATVLVACKCFWNVKNNLILFKDNAPHKQTYNNNEQTIDNESIEDEENSAHGPNKTLLPTNPKAEKQEVMWSIE